MLVWYGSCSWLATAPYQIDQLVGSEIERTDVKKNILYISIIEYKFLILKLVIKNETNNY